MKLERAGSTLIVKLRGELDHHVAEEIRNKIDREFSLGSLKNIIFDFTDVEFMDSSGIGMVVGRYKSCLQNGGELRIFGVSERIDTIFRISGLYKIINRYNSLEDAQDGL